MSLRAIALCHAHLLPAHLSCMHHTPIHCSPGTDASQQAPNVCLFAQPPNEPSAPARMRSSVAPEWSRAESGVTAAYTRTRPTTPAASRHRAQKSSPRRRASAVISGSARSMSALDGCRPLRASNSFFHSRSLL